MPHGVSWLNFIPGYQALEHWAMVNLPLSVMKQSPVMIQHMVAGVLVLLLFFVIALIYRFTSPDTNDAAIPDDRISIRNMLEVLLETLYNSAKDQLGEKEAKRLFPVLAGIGLFILISNLLGLIPGMSPPTENWNTTIACALFVFFYYNFHAFRVQGWHYIAHTANPIGAWWGWILAPFFFPIEIIGHLARPFSLSVRLMANMMGDHKVLWVFVGLAGPLVPIPFIVMGLLVSVIQTVVFVLLTVVYLKIATEVADEH